MTDHRGKVHVRRIYEEVEAPGARVLVDRMWPRGISKERADLTRWAKEAAPSDALRRWYDHDPDRHEEFAERYRQELDEEDDEAVADLETLAKQGGLVLLTATKDVELSHAVVLAELLRERL